MDFPNGLEQLCIKKVLKYPEDFSEKDLFISIFQRGPSLEMHKLFNLCSIKDSINRKFFQCKLFVSINNLLATHCNLKYFHMMNV